MIDVPKFYSKTPLLAYTVIFSMSEIESLEINPKHLNEFNNKQRLHLEKLYSGIVEEL